MTIPNFIIWKTNRGPLPLSSPFNPFKVGDDAILKIDTLSLLYKQRSDLATGLGALGVACECCLISKT